MPEGANGTHGHILAGYGNLVRVMKVPWAGTVPADEIMV